ncbi:hypothetical protein COV58_02970 [Candidatus Roizmanbacteria bacterium CG11_big_fil_rev_8_21_14_0_20_36_8]|uniref:Ceramidase n=2 Tax=Candidatus Roizmaniibacteriota TaxID=1752723 RepID=A0A2M8F3S1_9BACT|nr:MAG: hypothetical protein COV58_02970 [Candidatus Roizmanbacteria bacterium CG11_big_fil_rev_8_21_14_0_20_36_8]PIR64131.1 MAG: hypothetical protein COU64_00780 [Candidatus Pacebacteria bacterium CG10_big_fil_rev_8_21_14_0_10_40_26]PIZ64846.1 MAG: hypothetical protein COY15_04285 [Candidatus Roizmanbacteria bacterium CG_4_10_14_0_2_um_filter_39_12]PJC33890.1 MAG: hypothetical protein CO051_00705 [Candidatus Roizmanbacteria bacterium CG_4_9_14_0_2_um_filter_39_13]
MNTLEALEKGMSTYCESGVGLFYTQPINTISNITLLISAYFAFRLIRTNHVNNKTIKILPFILAVTGIGSMLWHGMPSLLTNFADTLPLSAFVLVSLFFLLDKLLNKRGLVWKILLAFILVETPFIFHILPSLNGFVPYLIVFVFGVFLSYGLVKKYKILTSHLVTIIALFAMAFFFRTIDHTVCAVFSAGTHFIWHTLNALVFYLLIRVFILMDLKTLSLKREQ